MAIDESKVFNKMAIVGAEVVNESSDLQTIKGSIKFDNLDLACT